VKDNDCKPFVNPIDVKQGKRLKVLINPFGGQGKAKLIFERQVKPIFEAAKCFVDVQCQLSSWPYVFVCGMPLTITVV
jgi:hypothetical protein